MNPPAESTACPADEPICDTTGTCVACTHHTQCDSGACGLYNAEGAFGTCIPEDEIAYVDLNAPAPTAQCTRSNPCLAISVAAATNHRYVVVAPAVYTETVALAALAGTGGMLGRELIGYGAELNTQAGTSAITLTGAAALHGVHGFRIVDAEQGVAITGGKVTLADLVISDHAGIGVNASAANLRVLRSRIQSNAGGGIRAVNTGTSLEIFNSFINGNGTAGSDLGGIHVGNPSILSIAFNTLTNNSCSATTCTAPAVECVGCGSAIGGDGTTGGSAHSNIIIGNPVVGGQQGQVSSENGGFPAYEHCIFTGDPGFAADGYHIQLASSPVVDQGKPQSAGVAVLDDIDGQRRPLDTPDIGADECIPDTSGMQCE